MNYAKTSVFNQVMKNIFSMIPYREYLTDEVFTQQAQPVQDFLLKTSLLDQLCAPLCETVTRQPDAGATLAYLEQANLFTIAVDECRTWYHYHHLFRDFLRERLSHKDRQCGGFRPPRPCECLVRAERYD